MFPEDLCRKASRSHYPFEGSIKIQVIRWGKCQAFFPRKLPLSPQSVHENLFFWGTGPESVQELIGVSGQVIQNCGNQILRGGVAPRCSDLRAVCCRGEMQTTEGLNIFYNEHLKSAYFLVTGIRINICFPVTEQRALRRFYTGHWRYLTKMPTEAGKVEIITMI